MFKLIALTLVGLYLALTFLGEGPAPAKRAVAAAPEAPAEVAPTDKIIQVAQQTPEKIQEFAGPELRVSPEHAGEVEEVALAEAATDTLFVTGNRVNFRAGPTTRDSVIGALTRGAVVQAVGAKNGAWVEIRDSRGRVGFMSAKFLSANKP